MFVNDKFTILMFTLRISKQGIPIYFRCFNGKGKNGYKDAFNSKTILDGILYCHNLFKSKGFNIIFLADRWFGNHFEFLKYIESLGDTYVVRTMANVKTLEFDKKEGHKVWKNISELQCYSSRSNIFPNITITRKEYITNLVISKSNGHKEPWYIITNGNVNDAIKNYGY